MTSQLIIKAANNCNKIPVQICENGYQSPEPSYLKKLAFAFAFD